MRGAKQRLADMESQAKAKGVSAPLLKTLRRVPSRNCIEWNPNDPESTHSVLAFIEQAARKGYEERHASQ